MDQKEASRTSDLRKTLRTHLEAIAQRRKGSTERGVSASDQLFLRLAGTTDKSSARRAAWIAPFVATRCPLSRKVSFSS